VVSKKQNAKANKGNSIIEFSLLLPWFIFLFTGVFDFGFYAYALIAAENAARVAVLRSAANNATAADQSGACALAVTELTGLPNVGPSYSGSCNADPLTVTSSYCDSSTPCSGSTGSVDGGPAAFVTVTYSMPPLFRIPIPGVTHITRTAEMRLRDALP
jgi:TadE-like protein